MTYLKRIWFCLIIVIFFSCSNNPCIYVGEYKDYHVKKSFGARSMLETDKGIYPVSDVASFRKDKKIYLKYRNGQNLYKKCNE